MIVKIAMKDIKRYFTSNQVCKFDITYSYLYVTLKERGDIFQLNNKTNQLESLAKSMSQKIELDVVKTKKEINTNDLSSEKEIKCDLCEYTASSSTVLKRHVTMKHKRNEKSAEAPNQFKCKLCEPDLLNRTDMRAHVRSKLS